MKISLLFPAIVCCLAWFLFFNAAELADEFGWASTACSIGPMLCRNPQPLEHFHIWRNRKGIPKAADLWILDVG
ncbi:MAG: hypothetical protein WCA56_13475 [Xanthobacteraceae bacterium]